MSFKGKVARTSLTPRQAFALLFHERCHLNDQR